MTLLPGYKATAQDVVDGLEMDLNSDELLAVAVNIIRIVKEEFLNPDDVIDEVIRALEDDDE